MERIVLKHLSGSKANQVEEFPLAHVRELVFGRDPSSTVKYDPDRDDLVGRQHARIAQDPADPSQFVITDLNSRNGTFLNRQRVNGTTRINVGDVVQFGPGGPEFVFEIEPRPAGATKPTRSVSSSLPPTVQAPTSPVPQTRVGAGGASMPPPPTGAPAGSVGRNTVMRMIDENVTQAKKQQGRKYALVGAAAFVAVVVLVAGIGGFLWWRSRSGESAARAEIGELKSGLAAKEATASLPPNVIAKENRNAVVKLEVSWRLISPGGGLVYHQYVPDPDGRGPVAAPPGTAFACYVLLEDGKTIEPLLSYDGNRFSVAVGGQHSGSGFVVSSDGFILTNRHVAAAWETTYDFPDSARQGVLFDTNGNFLRVVQGLPEWVPSKTRQIIKQGRFDGRNDRLSVAFPGSENRIAAQLVQSSPRHDVAMIKISVPDPTPKVEINDNYDTIQPGDAAIVLGYPAVSPPVFGIVKSQDIFNRETKVEEIPDPTLSVGNVGRLLRDREAQGGRQGQISTFGDVYQLTINSTGAGNSGGPVFDDRGRVTGILFASRRTDATITFAVPIRYGKELMSVTGGR